MRDLLTKESLFEKPYLSDGRAEMHMEMPSFTYPRFPAYPQLPPYPPFPPFSSYRFSLYPKYDTFPEYGPFPGIKYPPPYERYVPRDWSYSPFPTKDGQQPTGSVSAFPVPKRTEQYPRVTAISDPTKWGIGWTVPYCNIWDFPPDCMEEGDSVIIRVHFGAYTTSMLERAEWHVEVSSDTLRVSLFATEQSRAYFLLEALDMSEGTVSVCFYVEFGEDPFGRPIASTCGCLEIEGCDVCPVDPTVSWDPDSDATITRNSSATILVLGGKGPYSWSVSGTGFTLDSPITNNRNNGLNADGTACGSAEITVTDGCGVETTGYVREDNTANSQWVLTGEKTCMIPGPYGWISGGNDYNRIEGNRKMTVEIATKGAGSSCPGFTYECPGRCADVSSCTDCYGGVDPCTECITNYNLGDVGSWPCFLGDWCVASNGYSTIICPCNKDIRNWTWECK